MSDEEKRKFTRVPFESTVRITYGETIIVSRKLKNVSLGGAFVVAQEFFPAGTVCDLDIELRGPGSLLLIKIEGEVVRSDPDGMALRFTKMDLDGLIHLRHLVRIYAEDPELVDLEFSTHLLGLEIPS